MSVPLVTAPVVATAPTTLAAQSLPSAVGVSSPQDLERLRALVATDPATAPAQAPQITAAGEVAPAEQSTLTTLGDSILNGVAKFNSGYDDSLQRINQRLNHINETDALNLGTDFGEILTLQIEVARWSMSVMGVDNASKAGTNTVKELSRGG